MSLPYSYIDWKYPLAPPPFKVNGGLYTGEAAKGPWGNYPVLPEPNELSKNLLTANPPPNAEKIPITYNRAGNNFVTFPNHTLYNNDYPQLICRK